MGTIWPSRRYIKLVFLGQNSGCIDSGWVMARHTRRQCLNFPMRYMLPGNHTSLLYTPVVQEETSSNCMGHDKPHTPTYWDWFMTGKAYSGYFHLQSESVPQLEWELAISCGKRADKVVLKGLYCPFCCINTMVMGFYLHLFAIVLDEKFLYGLICLVVHDV